MRVIFFGSSKFVVPIIEMLRKKFDLALVLTTERLPTDAVPACCIKNNIPYISVQQFNNETIEQFKKVHAPVAVLAYFGLILPETVLNIFPKGIINIHPSLLPKYRGPTPGQSALLANETKTGVTIIKLDKEVDHGPVLDQVEETILPNDTTDSLYTRLFASGVKLLEKSLNDYMNNKITLKEQNHFRATFTPHLNRNDGYIDLDKSLPAGRQAPPPKQLDRMIRAYYPWPGVWTRQIINGKPSIIKFLPLQKLQVEGKKPMSYKDFINGYPGGKAFLEKLQLS